MIAKQTNHGKAANNTATATARAATAKSCRRTDASATGRAGDVPAADTAEKEATVQTTQTNGQQTATRNGAKFAERRKERRKQRKAEKKSAQFWAKRGLTKEQREWVDF